MEMLGCLRLPPATSFITYSTQTLVVYLQQLISFSADLNLVCVYQKELLVAWVWIDLSATPPIPRSDRVEVMVN